MTYYLYTHPNPNAPVRANGIRFWGYPARTSAIRVLVVHTPEVLPDYTGTDDSAEKVAAYFASTDRPASAHVCIDRDSIVHCLPDEATAFHVRNYNSISLGAEIGHAHNAWGQNLTSDEAVLNRSAAWFAEKALLYDIPVRRLTRAQVDAGERGIVAHADLDPTRRIDPGATFNWDRFFTLINQHKESTVSAKDWNNDTWRALVDTGIVQGNQAYEYWTRQLASKPGDADYIHAENVVMQMLASRSVPGPAPEPAPHTHPAVLVPHTHKVSVSGTTS